VAAGLIGFEITWRAEVYDGAPQESSAADYGTLGITFCARKPRDQKEWQEWHDAVLAAQSCELPPARQAGSAQLDGG
jgi:hypothetical protein